MRILIKALGIGAAVVVAVAAAVALGLWLFFDPNDYRGELEALVESRTGREFSIDDELALTFFPWLGVETGRLRLGQTEGFGDDDFAGVDSAAMRLRLLPLLRGRLEVGAVVLDGLRLNLARDDEGRGNWTDLLDPAPGAAAAAPAADPGHARTGAQGASRFTEIDIAGIDIRNGIVFWRENVGDVKYVVSDLALRTGRIAPGTDIDAAVGLRVVGVAPAFTLRLDGRGTVAGDFGPDGLQASDLNLDFRLEDGHGDERATGRIAATLAVDAAARTARFGALELESELAGFPAGAARMSVTATAPAVNLDYAARTATIPAAAATAGDIGARWRATVDGSSGEPLVAGHVAIDAAPLAQAAGWFGLEHAAELGDFSLAADFRLEPLARRAALTNLDGALLDMALSGAVAVSETEVSGHLAAPVFDPGVLLSLLPREWTAGARIAAVDQLALDADFSVGRGGAFAVREFALGVQGATVTGAIERPADGAALLRGRIAAADVDPDLLLALLSGALPDALSSRLGAEALGTFGLSLAFDYRGAASGLLLSDLAVRAYGLRTSGELTVSTPWDTPAATGTLRVEPFSPRALLARFGETLPTTADPDVFSEAFLSAEVSIDGGRAEFSHAQMRMDDTALTGSVRVEGYSAPRFFFDLDMDRIDLDRYLPVRIDGPADAADVDLADGVDVDPALRLEGRLQAGELRSSGLSFGDVSGRIVLDEGLGRIESLEARLHGGEIAGALELDTRMADPILALQTAAEAVDIGPLLAALTREPAPVTGAGNLHAELVGTGASLADLLATATGSMEFTLHDGTLEGVDLNHSLCDVYNRLQGHARPALPASEATPYRLIRGAMQVRNGIASTDNFLAVTPNLEAGGGGRLDLVSLGIDFDLEAKLTGRIPIPRCETLDDAVGDSIPLQVDGALTAPEVMPDFAGWLRERLRDSAQDAVLDRLKELLD